MNFSERLRLARKNLGLTQRAVAEAIGITEGAYNAYEKGKREPNLEKIRLLANTFKISADFLLNTNEYNPNAVLNITEQNLLDSYKKLDSMESESDLMEKKLILLYRSVNEQAQEKILGYADDIVSSGKYKKSDEYSMVEKSS